MWEKASAAKSPPPPLLLLLSSSSWGVRWGAFSGVVYSPRLVITMMDLSSDWSCVPCCAHVRLFFDGFTVHYCTFPPTFLIFDEE